MNLDFTSDLAKMSQLVDESMDVGDDVWKENRAAVRFIDLKNDGERGREALESLLSGLEDWEKNFKEIKDVADAIEERALRALYKGQYNTDPEDDS